MAEDHFQGVLVAFLTAVANCRQQRRSKVRGFGGRITDCVVRGTFVYFGVQLAYFTVLGERMSLAYLAFVSSAVM